MKTAPADVRARTRRRMAAALRKNAIALDALSERPTSLPRRIAHDLRERAAELELEADQLAADGEALAADVLKVLTLMRAHGDLRDAFRNPQNPPPPRGEA